MPRSQPLPRTLTAATAVTALHIAALWAALQSGVASRPLETLVPAMVLSEVPAAPAPAPQPPSPPTPAIAPRLPPQPIRPARQTAPQPEPVLATEAASATEYTAAVSAPPLPPAAPAAPTPAVAARIELPSTNADYLQNCAPQYPPLSRRLGEQGKVLVRVLIGADGQAQRTELKRSSGFDRLDRAALESATRCRYAPGKVGGVAQAMWYDAPVNFILE